MVTIPLQWGRIAGDREGLNTLRTVVRPGRTALGQERQSADADRPGESAGEPAEGPSVRAIKSPNAENIIVFISSEMGLSDRTGKPG